MTTRTPQTDPNHRAKHSTPKPQEQIEPNLTESFFTDEIQRDSHSLNQNQILQLQRTIGNQAVIRTMGQSPNTNSTDKKVQRKLEGELEKYKSVDVLVNDLGEFYVIPSGVKLNILKNDLIKFINDKNVSYKSLAEIANAAKLKAKQEQVIEEINPEKEKEPVLLGGTTWTPNNDGLSKTKITVSAGLPPQEFGQLALAYRFDEKGLEITADVFSNPKLIWEHGDKVSITLQFKNPSVAAYLIGDLRVQKNGNIIKLVSEISYENLARMLKMETPQGSIKEKRNALALGSAQMGVLAMWRTVDDKGEQHRSGGIDQKGGSGLINVSATPITEKTLEKTETEGIRNVGWNESEKNNPDRPLIKNFPNLIKLEEEIATTLEAESEYIVGKDGYKQILEAMLSISGTDKEELLKSFGITKEVKPSVKVYVDTYYDLASGEEDDKGLPLLENNVVFRHRSVPKELNKGEGDVEGTNLITIKGRSVTNEFEAIRLAAQFQAKYDMLKPEKQEEVMNFLKSEEVDNPFARTLRDSLKHSGQEKTLEKATGLKKALTVISTRTKYKLWLENSTMIDLSVDEAKGTMEGVEESPDHLVYSFEFGVGHPGLSAGATGSGGLAEEDPTLNTLKEGLKKAEKENNLGVKTMKSDQIKARQAKTSQLVHRPYHVPKDLENESLFKKDDYIQYKGLRDALIDKLFKMNKSELERGGNKAKLLAQKMGLLPTK